jgi:amidohydrolase
MVSGLPAGRLCLRAGPFQASADEFTITVSGRQTHGARPWAGVDPIVIGAQIVTALQSIQSRQVDVNDPSVLTVGQFHAGNRNNIIPDRAVMNGTLRTFDDKRRDFIKRRVIEVAEGVAKGMDGSAAVHWEPNGYPVSVNDPGLAERLLPTLARVAGEPGVRALNRSMAAEDFSYFAQLAPGFFFNLGATDPATDPATAPNNHSPRFRVDERGLVQGVRAMLHLVADYSGSALG